MTPRQSGSKRQNETKNSDNSSNEPSAGAERMCREQPAPTYHTYIQLPPQHWQEIQILNATFLEQRTIDVLINERKWWLKEV